MKKIYIILASIFINIATQQAQAQQAGTLDNTYNVADSSISELRGELYSRVLTLASGKIIAAGTRIVRFYESGYVDNSFTIGNTNGGSAFVYALAEQPDGKLLVGGAFTKYNGQNKNYIVRLNTDGSVDQTFAAGADQTIQSIAIQSDGKILIGGIFTLCNGISSKGIARLNNNGTLDTSFTSSIPSIPIVYSIKLQTDGKIMVGGSFTKNIVRLASNGTIDNSFSVGTGFNGDVNSIALQSNGKIIVGGVFTSYNGTTVNRIIRLDANGSIDNSFTIGGGFSGGDVFSLLIEPNGKIIIEGTFSTFNGNSSSGIIRLTNSGSIDNTFTVGTGLFLNPFNAIYYLISAARLSNGRIIVCGSFTIYNSVAVANIIELNTNGGIYNNYSTQSGFNGVVNAIAVQPDGKAIYGGDFTSYNGSPAPRIIRLTAQGEVDTSFHTGSGFDYGVRSIALQGNGKIIIGGLFANYNNTSNNAIYIVRLESNGNIDTSFNNNLASSTVGISALNIQTDGKILAGGYFGITNLSQYWTSLGRLNDDGSRDTNFTVGSNANTRVSFKIQTNGKIIVAGAGFSNNLVRLNTDGTVDNSFAVGTGITSNVYSILIQPNGKILLGGDFTSYNGLIANRIIRLNSNGSKDNSFNTGSAFDGLVRTMALQNDGNILVGGDFLNYNGASANSIIRIKDDGSKDFTFESGTGFNKPSGTTGSVYALALQSDDKVLVGGNFTTYNGRIRSRIARLYNNSCPSDILVNTTDASCGNNNGSISLGAVTGGLAPYTYSVNNLSYSSKTQFAAVPEGGYDLLVKDANGCVYTAPEVTVLGSSSPPYDVSVSTTNSACGSSNGALSIGLISGGTFPYQYNVNGLGYASSSNYANLAGGSYSLLVKDANNCVFTAPLVTINNNDVNYNVLFSADNTVLTSFPFNVNFSNQSADTMNKAYTWYFGDGSSYTGVTPPTHVYPENGIYSVTLLSTDTANGCTDTLTLPNYISCSGGPTGLCNQTASINEASPVNGCAGGIAVLHCTTNAASPSYQWNLNGVPVGGATQNSFTALFNGYYSVTVYNYGGCPITSAGVAVNFNNVAPTRPVISQFGSIQPCTNDSVILTVLPGFSNYLWSNGDTAHSIKIGTAGVYTVTGININGCDAVSLPQQVTASALPAPNICMVTVDTALIKNIIVWEKTPSNLIDSFIVYKETNAAGVFVRIGTQSYAELSEFTDTSSRPLIKSERYRLAIKDTCGSLTLPGTIHKTMHLQITPGIGDDRNLSWNPQEGIYFPSYQLLSGNPPSVPFTVKDTVASTVNTYTDVNPVAGIDTKYLVQIILPSGGCTSTARTLGTRIKSNSNTAGNRTISIADPLGIQKKDYTIISVAPNPSNGIFTISANTNASAQIRVYNILGNLVVSKKVNQLNRQSIDLSSFTTGFYECHIVGERINVVKKLVKE